jgi:hypothetical protein
VQISTASTLGVANLFLGERTTLGMPHRAASVSAASRFTSAIETISASGNRNASVSA